MNAFANESDFVVTGGCLLTPYCMTMIDPSDAVESTSMVLDLEVPDSFWKGLADCDAGRVVDFERALEEDPPNQNE
jgi:hypothetical protein